MWPEHLLKCRIFASVGNFPQTTSQQPVGLNLSVSLKVCGETWTGTSGRRSRFCEWRSGLRLGNFGETVKFYGEKIVSGAIDGAGDENECVGCGAGAGDGGRGERLHADRSGRASRPAAHAARQADDGARRAGRTNDSRPIAASSDIRPRKSRAPSSSTPPRTISISFCPTGRRSSTGSPAAPNIWGGPAGPRSAR